MGTRGGQIKTQFCFVDKSLVVDFVCSNMYRVVRILWFVIWRCLFPAFGSIFKLLFRFHWTKSSSLDFVHHQEKYGQVGSSGSVDSSVDDFNEERYRYFVNNSGSKYEFLYGEGIIGFLEEPKTMSFTIHDVFDSSVGDEGVNKATILETMGHSEKDFRESQFEAGEKIEEVCKSKILAGEKTEEACISLLEAGEKTEEAYISELEAGEITEEPCKSEIEAGKKTEEAGEVPTNLVVEEVLKMGENHTYLEEKDFHYDYLIIHDHRYNSDEDSGPKGMDHGKAEDSALGSLVKEVLEEPELENFTKEETSPKEKFNPGFETSTTEDFRESRLETEGYVTDEAELCNIRKGIEEEMGGSETIFEDNFDQDEIEKSVGSNGYCSRSSDKIDSTSNSNLNDGFQPESPIFSDEDEEGDYNKESVFLMHEFTDSDDEYIEFAPQKQYSISSDDEVWSEENLHEIEDVYVDHAIIHEEAEPETEHLDKSQADFLQEIGPIGNPVSNYNIKHDNSDSDSDSDSDFLFEHQDIIEQLKMELKNARTGGLPTIQEESENEESSRSPLPMVQELKPLRIKETKFAHQDCIDEIQKVYKSYSDKMRKLDILNYQTMHAFGLLQIKDSFQSQTSRKFSLPAMKTLLFHNFFSCKQVASVMDPSKKITADMHKDFETVYVGQLCLSWEILRWQCQKAQELQTHESQGSSYCYNQVAAEFQLFQVLIHRFIENEAFQGPRVQNYVQSRSILRNLLQIPVIKDDNSKDKGKRGDAEDAVTIQMLTSIVEQSMHVFWDFLRGDKDYNAVIHHQAPISLPDQVDLELLTNVRNNIQKKKKKLKDIMRSGNCIVKRFQKHQEDERDLLLMVAQVELKLVRRVLNMSKVKKDQLIWCLEKLNKIKLNNRRILIEPSFLLFPC